MGERVYDVHLLFETGDSIRASVGVPIAAEPFHDANFDTLIVDGGIWSNRPTAGLIEFVQQALRRCRRVAATCTGAFIPAGAARQPQPPRRSASKSQTNLWLRRRGAQMK